MNRNQLKEVASLHPNKAGENKKERKKNELREKQKELLTNEERKNNQQTPMINF